MDERLEQLIRDVMATPRTAPQIKAAFKQVAREYWDKGYKAHALDVLAGDQVTFLKEHGGRGFGMSHNYVFQRCVPETHEDARFHWVIFCTKCGHVAYFGNNTTVSNERMQADLPRPCAPPQPEDPTEVP